MVQVEYFERAFLEKICIRWKGLMCPLGHVEHAIHASAFCQVREKEPYKLIDEFVKSRCGIWLEILEPMFSTFAYACRENFALHDVPVLV